MKWSAAKLFNPSLQWNFTWQLLAKPAMGPEMLLRSTAAAMELRNSKMGRIAIG
jgi:hypothetical protein